MPIILGGSKAGSRLPASLQLHRPASQTSAERLRVGPGGRRQSQLSNVTTATRQTIQQVDKPGPTTATGSIHRTVSSAPSQPPDTWKSYFRKAYQRWQLKHLFPLFFVMLYMLLGACLFYWIESGSDAEIKRENNKVYLTERELLRRRMEEIMTDKAAKRRNLRRKFIDEAMDHYENQIGYQVKNNTQWDFMSSMYFAGTLFTTIGYGDIACVTTAGRILTVVYSCLGIPLMLITLSALGKFLYNNINGCVDSIDSAYLGVLNLFPRRRQTPPDEVDMVERGEAPDVSSIASEMGSEHQMEAFDEFDENGDAPVRMSVKVALGITVGWILVCAAIFQWWEDWTYGESLYFMYISCSTIGLGDISVTRRDMMNLCFIFVIVGLSLVSMTINVVQVALEDFYVKLIMKLILDYQEKIAAGGDHMGASMGMMKMFGKNRAAKMLMPLISKEQKRVAMEKVGVKARAQGLDFPSILTEIDEKTGIPKLFCIEEKSEEGEGPSMELEELVQKQILLEEESILPIYIAHDAQTQTEIVPSMERMEQTESVITLDDSVQTEEEKKDCVMEETQTESTEGTDVATQMDIEKIECEQAESQTEGYEGTAVETQTFTVATMDAETGTVVHHQSESESQTEVIHQQEQEIQTFIAELKDTQNGTEVETKNIRIQTPCPIIEQRTSQTDDLSESRKSPSKMSSAKKRLRRAFAKQPKQQSLGPSPAMSDWKDVEPDSEVLDDEGSEESLHWDPVDGMHAEKQLPVSHLAKMFDKNLDEIRKRSEVRSGRKSSSFKKEREPSRTRTSSQ